MKQFRNLLWLAAIAVTAMLSSCSSKDDPMEVIPDDVDFLVKIDATKILNAADIKVDGDEAKLPKEISNLMGRKEKKIFTTILTQAGEALDLSKIAIYGYFDTRKPEVYAAIPVKDSKDLEKLLTETPEDFDKDGLDKDEEEGYTTFTKGKEDFGVYVKDDMAYMVFDDKDPIGALQEMADKAKEKSFNETHAKLIEQAEKDAAIVIYANPENVFSIANKMEPEIAIVSGVIQKELEGYWSVCSFSINDKTFTANAKYVNDEGKLYSIPYGQKISKDALKYMPDYFVAAAAVGISPNDLNQLQKIYNQYAGQLGSDDREVLDQLMNYAKQIDGTVAVGFGARDLRSISSGNFEFVAVAQMKGGAANSALNALRQLWEDKIQEEKADYYYDYYNSHTSLTDIPNGFTVNVSNDRYSSTTQTFNVQVMGNDLVVSNVGNLTAGNNSLANLVGANDIMAFVLNVASFAPYTNGQLDFGFNASIQATKQEVDTKASITGTKESLLQVIMSLAGFADSYDPYGSYDYGYDYDVPADSTTADWSMVEVADEPDYYEYD